MAKVTLVTIGMGLLVLAVAASAWHYQQNMTPQALHKKVVLGYLNDPDSAKFGTQFQSTRDKTVWCGEVNAKNKMGSMAGFTRYVVYLNDHADIAGIRNEIYIDSPDAVGDAAKDAAMVFVSKWNIFCRP
jgi:hypothetical protein